MCIVGTTPIKTSRGNVKGYKVTRTNRRALFRDPYTGNEITYNQRPLPQSSPPAVDFEHYGHCIFGDKKVAEEYSEGLMAGRNIETEIHRVTIPKGSEYQRGHIESYPNCFRIVGTGLPAIRTQRYEFI